MNYLERFYRVLKYIDSNLEDDLSLNSLSGIANLAKHYFHRQFSSLFGIGVSAYIKRLRMKKASYQLAFRDEIRIIDVALMNGYKSSEAFSRAFKEFQGQSPRQFRKSPDWISWHENNRSLNKLRMNNMTSENFENTVKITKFNESKVAVIEHRGNPNLLMETVKKFIAWRKENNKSPNVSRTFNIVYDDPNEVSPKNYKMDICCSVDSGVEENDYGVYLDVIPGGRCAVVRCIGGDENLRKIVRWLYAEWLPDSGEELRDYPLFFERIKFFPDVSESEMITDIFLPVKDATPPYSA